MSPQEALAIFVGEIFAGANARAALPKLLATIDELRPDLIVRDSVEFGALIAAEARGVPHARVAVHTVSFEEPLPSAAAASLDALRQGAGLPADGGRSLYDEPVFNVLASCHSAHGASAWYTAVENASPHGASLCGNRCAIRTATRCSCGSTQNTVP